MMANNHHPYEYSKDWINDKLNSFALEPALELYPVQYHTSNIPILKDIYNSVSEWKNTARSLNISKQEISMMESAFFIKPFSLYLNKKK